MECHFDSLKSRQREIRDTFPESLGLRVHRALSWLQRAEMCEGDDDARFIFLWIAFNAAYANDIDDRQRFTEQKVFRNYLGRLVELDGQGRLYSLVWKQFSGPIRLLLDNEYVFQPFWDYHNAKIAENEWKERFSAARKAASKALGASDTTAVLGLVFARLYTLRNQIVHGGSTWNSSVNRTQVRDGANIMGLLVPDVISIMMDSPDVLWGDPCYPVID